MEAQNTESPTQYRVCVNRLQTLHGTFFLGAAMPESDSTALLRLSCSASSLWDVQQLSLVPMLPSLLRLPTFHDYCVLPIFHRFWFGGRACILGSLQFLLHRACCAAKAAFCRRIYSFWAIRIFGRNCATVFRIFWSNISSSSWSAASPDFSAENLRILLFIYFLMSIVRKRSKQ